jgi:hypothetical protein
MSCRQNAASTVVSPSSSPIIIIFFFFFWISLEPRHDHISQKSSLARQKSSLGHVTGANGSTLSRSCRNTKSRATLALLTISSLNCTEFQFLQVYRVVTIFHKSHLHRSAKVISLTQQKVISRSAKVVSIKSDVGHVAGANGSTLFGSSRSTKPPATGCPKP